MRKKILKKENIPLKKVKRKAFLISLFLKIKRKKKVFILKKENLFLKIFKIFLKKKKTIPKKNKRKIKNKVIWPNFLVKKRKVNTPEKIKIKFTIHSKILSKITEKIPKEKGMFSFFFKAKLLKDSLANKKAGAK